MRPAPVEDASLLASGASVTPHSVSLATDAMLGYLDAHPEQAEAILGQVPLQRWDDTVRDAGGLAIFLASSDLTGTTFQLDSPRHCHIVGIDDVHGDSGR